MASPIQYPRTVRCALLVGSAFSLALYVTAAFAQDNGGYDDEAAAQAGSGEQVEVIAPPYSFERTRLGAPPGRITLSHAVRYDDLDLRTAEGAHILKARIRETAGQICAQLADDVPYAMAGSPPCYRTVVDSALNRADTAIGEARFYADRY